MNDEILRLEDLSCGFASATGEPHVIVDDVSFSLERGKTFALLGESGCGKSLTALSIMGLLPYPDGRLLGGDIWLENERISRYSEQQMRGVRGRRISMIFQEPMTSLNPVMSIGQQILEVLRLHRGLRGKPAQERALELLEAVKLPDAAHKLDSYPHQLSGGMKQRVMIAMALAGEPDVLIADEPTTALDVTIQAQVLALMQEIQQRTGMAILLITHDMGVVSRMADEVAVMYAGQIMEQGSVKEFFRAARHPYSQALFRALPSIQQRGQALQALPGSLETKGGRQQCLFASRCAVAAEDCWQQAVELKTDPEGWAIRCLHPQAPVAAAPLGDNDAVNQVDEAEVILRVEDLRVHFPMRKGLLKRVKGYVRAVDGVSLQVRAGQTLALVGESGCGKTSVAKALLRLQKPLAADAIEFLGKPLQALSDRQFRQLRGEMQMIFQDPFSSMNPRLTVQQIVAEGLQTQQPHLSSAALQSQVAQWLERVGLDAGAAQRYPHEFSGGQRQRISIARALALQPRLLVCDEPTSALDVSVQAQVLNLLSDLQQELGLAYLFITHNLAVVSYLADEIAVMYLGRIVERGPVDAILEKPRHPYTQSLLQAAPQLGDNQGFDVLAGETPSVIEPPSGCHFHPRCERADSTCRAQYPSVRKLDRVEVACHHINS